MIIEKVLMLGERLDLGIDGLEYKSSVQDIIDRTTFLVANPLDNRNLPIHLDMDSVLKVVFYRDNGRFQFQASVLGRARINNLALVRLSALKGDPIKIQRRGSYRLQRSVTVSLRPVYETAGQKESYTHHTVDISEGGMLVNFEDMVPLDTLFDMEFTLDHEDFEPIFVRGCVRRLVPPMEHGFPWKLGIEFLNLSEMEKRRISRYVFRTQTAQRAEQNR